MHFNCNLHIYMKNLQEQQKCGTLSKTGRFLQGHKVISRETKGINHFSYD